MNETKTEWNLLLVSYWSIYKMKYFERINSGKGKHPTSDQFYYFPFLPGKRQSWWMQLNAVLNPYYFNLSCSNNFSKWVNFGYGGNMSNSARTLYLSGYISNYMIYVCIYIYVYIYIYICICVCGGGVCVGVWVWVCVCVYPCVVMVWIWRCSVGVICIELGMWVLCAADTDELAVK